MSLTLQAFHIIAGMNWYLKKYFIRLTGSTHNGRANRVSGPAAVHHRNKNALQWWIYTFELWIFNIYIPVVNTYTTAVRNYRCVLDYSRSNYVRRWPEEPLSRENYLQHCTVKHGGSSVQHCTLLCIVTTTAHALHLYSQSQNSQCANFLVWL